MTYYTTDNVSSGM